MTKETIQKAREQVDNYEQAVNACLTLIHVYKWDETNNQPDGNVIYWIGKEFIPGNVTPDIALQLSRERGLIIELKQSLPKSNSEEKDFWKERFEQIKKYDVQLKGWTTEDEFVKQQELMMMVDQKLARRVSDYIKANNLSFKDFSKNFCVIQFGPASGLNPAIFLRVEYGEIDDFKTITFKRLNDGITVALEYLLCSGLSKIKLLDYKPPVIYLMSILWDHVFSSMIPEDAWRQAKMEDSRKLIEITVTVSKLKEILIENFTDSKSKQGIKEKWIEEAIENFIRLKLAKKKKETDEYIIKYRKKLAGERAGADRHSIFAELLYKSGVQFTLEEFGPEQKEANT